MVDAGWSSSRSKSRIRRSGRARARPTAARARLHRLQPGCQRAHGAGARAITDRYRAAFEGTHTPLLGLARFVIMGDRRRGADHRAPAKVIAWHKHFHHLFQQARHQPGGGDRPPQFDQIKDGGRGIAGSP